MEIKDIMKKSENEDFSTWLFGICILDKHENNGGKIRYSSLLRFIVHIMLTMDEEVDIQLMLI